MVYLEELYQTFSAPYNKLVDNYPTKPIIIAEVGVAEPSDLPNLTYGQDGNDMDKIQSKEAWVADMFSRIESSYPAIRAVTWFNINKELSWALHKPNNNGLQAYKTTTQSSYYLNTFQNITQ
jgi:mannan endo-1,4-beta-mannosidase